MDSSTRFVAGLGEIELELLGSAVTYQMKAGPVRWRNLSGAIAQLRILQAGLGRLDSTTAIGVASALRKYHRPREIDPFNSESSSHTCVESGTAVTARREMIEVLHQKLTHGILRDDLVWPHSQPRLTNSKPLSVHWKQLEDRYSRTTSKGIADSDNISCLLPKQWSALSLHVTPDATSLLAVLYTCDSQPLILQLPFDRVSRRDGDEKIFDLQAARLEMSDITLSANATSQNAKNVTSSEDRRSWWTERKALDRRLAALLIDIEKKWLGAFKVCLKRHIVIHTRSMTNFSFDV